MKLGLLIIATNKYVEFLQQLISSADSYFFNESQIEIEYIVFTNKKINIESNRKINFIDVEHYPWPWMTLGRYKIFDNNKEFLKEFDYLFYSDVDMKFVDAVNEEILEERVATLHPGYFGMRGTPETNPESLACIYPHEPMCYFAGGFNGGSATQFLKMSNELSSNIEKDLKQGIIAVWHDESHLNRYMVTNPPTKILTPSYCYGESMNIPFPKKLLALNKNHHEFRS